MTSTPCLVGIDRSAKIFACPAANFVSAKGSPSQASLGWDHRVRSVAMDAAVGGPKYPISNFGWSQSSWYVALKSSDFHTPGPSDVWVFSDEHPDWIDDAIMYTANYGVTEFTELPGNQHGGACGMTFADGHSIVYKWKGSVMTSHLNVSYVSQPPPVMCLITDPDMLYLPAAHTPQN